ncbi:MAG: hypothetical protein IT243_02270 [Bacteroidia bacterium]|nr:hypothetical protein [Bacteroidia bacterium]
MRSADREKLSKKVRISSNVFALLAGVGILIILVQFYSGKSGLDFLENISYSISKLFAEQSESAQNKATHTFSHNDNVIPTNENLNLLTLEESKIKAEELLNNQISVNPISFETPLNEIPKENNKPQKFSLININSILKNIAFGETTIENNYIRKNLNLGVLPDFKSIKTSKFSIGFNISTGFSNCIVNYKNNNTSNNKYGNYQNEKERNNNNNALLKYSFGIDVFYRLNNKLTFNTGLYFINTGESVLVKEPDELSLYSNYKCANDYYFEGYPDFETPNQQDKFSNVRFSNNLSSFEIPIILNFKIRNNEKFTEIETQTGITYSRLYSVNTVVYNFGNDAYYIVSGINPKIYNSNNANCLLGIIYSKYITSNIQLFANPQCKIGLTNVFSKKYDIAQYNYSNLLRLGMKINL